MTSESASFDPQALTFDSRTGLSEPVAAQVAESIARLVAAMSKPQLVEIGAGTGEIGVHLAQLCSQYVGLDQSDAMLDQFRQRVRLPGAAQLVCQDANVRWPVESGSTHAIFGSRVFHLLEIDQVVTEVVRIAHPKQAIFLIGRIKRAKDSVKSQMRSKMRELMVERQLLPRKSRSRLNQLLARLSQYGDMLEPTVAAEWKAAATPAESIDSWANKDSMGGIVPPAEDKGIILEQLRRWAEKQYGDSNAEVVSPEQYILEGVRLVIKKTITQ